MIAAFPQVATTPPSPDEWTLHIHRFVRLRFIPMATVIYEP
jgi:hypothetical protein